MSNEISNLEPLQKLFIPAYEKNGEIVFEPSFSVNWESLAPPHLNAIDIKNPSRKELDMLQARKNSFLNSEFQYKAEIPSKQKKQMNCFLISPNGIDKLQLLGLSGTVRFTIGRNGKIWNKNYYGSIVSKIKLPNKKILGGFSICSSSPIILDKKGIGLSQEKIRKYFKSAHSLRYDAKVTDKEFWNVQTNYIFRLADINVRYNFFQLTPDNKCLTGCCSNKYFIVRVDKFDSISWHLSKCDV